MIRFDFEGMRDLLISYDPGAHAAYIKVRQGRVERTKEEAPGLYVDIGRDGRLLGVEILDPKRIQLKFIARLAKEFKVPELARINPRHLAGVYAPA